MEPMIIETMFQFPRLQTENERTIKETKKKTIYRNNVSVPKNAAWKRTYN
jgi:hypothetical protein